MRKREKLESMLHDLKRVESAMCGKAHPKRNSFLFCAFFFLASICLVRLEVFAEIEGSSFTGFCFMFMGFWAFYEGWMAPSNNVDCVDLYLSEYRTINKPRFDALKKNLSDQGGYGDLSLVKAWLKEEREEIEIAMKSILRGKGGDWRLFD